MSFLYPLFLLAGATIAIPILIHLFNLRRYKTVYFPHTRFLKNIQLRSQKQSQLRYKWLLAARILFLLLLILAFAQPFFNNKQQQALGNRLQIIYLDNSPSMSVKNGARTLLDVAKDAVRQQIQHAEQGKFLLLTNDKPITYQPITAQKTLAALTSINISATSKTTAQLLTTIQGLIQSEAMEGADVYYYSDFQQHGFPSAPEANLLANIHFYGIPIKATITQNIYIDTAFLTSPVLQNGQNNKLVVVTKLVGEAPKDNPVLQLTVNNQIKSAASISFNEKKESRDTLGFQVGNMGWQEIALTVNDASIRFDDTFRITARSAANLSILVLNEGQASPYIQAAFSVYNGFKLQQKNISEQQNWQAYNLVVLNGITSMNAALTQQLDKALAMGQSICIFPGKTSNIAALSEGLNKIAGVSIIALDTAQQPVVNLQQGSNLVRDIFERIPEQVQLPIANWHYRINASLLANQQSILSFRNGDPFLAQFTPSRGKLYLCATAADLKGSNFSSSYFFVPFLYQMAVQGKTSDVFAVMAGNPQPVYLSMNNNSERNMVHLHNNSIDIIPPQRPNGAGLDVFLDKATPQAGFYALTAQGNDTLRIAINQNRAESILSYWSLNELKTNWKGQHINWMEAADAAKITGKGSMSSFPLWKVCVILALLMLAAETYLLASGYRKQTVAAQ